MAHISGVPQLRDGCIQLCVSEQGEETGSETKQKHAQETMLDKWKSLINFPGTLLFEESVIRIKIYHVSRLPTFGI